MKVIFATTNERKLEDLRNVITKNNLDIEVLTMCDIGWDLGEIEETGNTIEENSLIKARAIYNFCKDKCIEYTIISDDAGLFVKALNGEPGIYTARYADAERQNNPTLPKYECVNKLLRGLENFNDRTAEYKCCVTVFNSDNEYFNIVASTSGRIAKKICDPLIKPYFYSVFIPEGYEKTFNLLNENELSDMYRYTAIKQALLQLKDINTIKIKRY
jgi:XTP/dITP diphosphohydrolase